MWSKNYHCALILSLVVVTVICAGDPAAVVNELPIHRAGSTTALWEEDSIRSDALANMLVQKDGRRMMKEALSPRSPQAMELLQADTSEEALMQSLQGKPKLEKQEALADAHVKEDRASLALSEDAQALQKLKGQMTLEVVNAKTLLARKSKKGSAAARRAAALAKRVMRKTRTVKADQAKENAAKKSVKQVASLISEDESASDQESANDTDQDSANDEVMTAKKAEATTPKDDPISLQLLTDASKYHAMQVSTASKVEAGKKKVASLETQVQTLKDSLNKARLDFRSERKKLGYHLKEHESARKMYIKISTKEKKHKLTRKLADTIRRQEASLRAQQLQIENSKEMLEKSMSQKALLSEDNQNDQTQEVATPTPRQPLSRRPKTTSIDSAVTAVKKDLRSKDIEKELRPEVEKLQKKGLRGKKLHRAIDGLVSQTVSKKVHTAMDKPAVKSAVKKAVGQAKAKIKNSKAKTAFSVSPSLAQREARDSIYKVNDADEALKDATSQLNAVANGHSGEELMMGLENALNAA